MHGWDRHNENGEYEVPARAGCGDANRGNETSAPVKDGVGEVGVYVGSFRATYSARYSQPHKCMAFERGLQDSGLELEGLYCNVFRNGTIR